MSNIGADSLDCTAHRAAHRPVRGVAARFAAVFRSALAPRCELCVARAGDSLVCDDCDAALPHAGPACPNCAVPSASGALCGSCIADPPPYAATIAAYAYAFPVDRLLQRLKYGGRIALADWAGAALADRVVAALHRRAPAERPDRVVALPLAAARQRERGFNQAAEIAVRIARVVGLPLASPLVRVTERPPQAALPWAERRDNVRGAFAVRGNVHGARVAMIDDVMTTGATLAESARVLTRAGAARVECWIVARTPPVTAP